MRFDFIRHLSAGSVLLGAALVAAACSTDTTGLLDPPVLQAKGGGGKGGGGNGGGKPGGGGGDVTVDAVDPEGAVRGTAGLVVVVTGSGFDSSSTVEFLLNGASTTDIVTTFNDPVSSTEVHATVNVADDAALDLYDVEVTASNGRKRGVGIESFEVFPLIDLSGAMVTTQTQGHIWTENKNSLSVEAARTCPGGSNCFEVELRFTEAVGIEAGWTRADLTDLGCVIDPVDMPDHVLARLVDHLDDPSQGREFGAHVDRRKGTGRIGAGAWTDDDGLRYAAHIDKSKFLPSLDVVVSEGPTDTFAFSGGVVRIRSALEPGGITNQYLVCPNRGSVTMVLTRN